MSNISIQNVSGWAHFHRKKERLNEWICANKNNCFMVLHLMVQKIIKEKGKLLWKVDNWAKERKKIRQKDRQKERKNERRNIKIILLSFNWLPTYVKRSFHFSLSREFELRLFLRCFFLCRETKPKNQRQTIYILVKCSFSWIISLNLVTVIM